jgi:hypothetical protein
MAIIKMAKQALFIGGSVAVGVFGGLLVVNRKKIKEKIQGIRNTDSGNSEEICFDDLNENSSLVNSDGTVNVDGNTVDDTDVSVDDETPSFKKNDENIV